jgi:hypothetical protein
LKFAALGGTACALQLSGRVQILVNVSSRLCHFAHIFGVLKMAGLAHRSGKPFAAATEPLVRFADFSST